MIRSFTIGFRVRGIFSLEDWPFYEPQTQNVKLLAQRFPVVICYHPGHPWAKPRINSFIALAVFKQNWTIMLRFSSKPLRLLALEIFAKIAVIVPSNQLRNLFIMYFGSMFFFHFLVKK